MPKRAAVVLSATSIVQQPSFVKTTKHIFQASLPKQPPASNRTVDPVGTRTVDYKGRVSVADVFQAAGKPQIVGHGIVQRVVDTVDAVVVVVGVEPHGEKVAVEPTVQHRHVVNGVSVGERGCQGERERGRG